MLKYCKVINEETKEVQVGLGTNIDFYKSIGFEEKEIIKVNGRYYLNGFEPVANLDEVKQKLKKEVEEKFYAEYPLYKQCNIAIFGTEEEKQKFKEFHDNLVFEYDKQIEIL